MLDKGPRVGESYAEWKRTTAARNEATAHYEKRIAALGDQYPALARLVYRAEMSEASTAAAGTIYPV